MPEKQQKIFCIGFQKTGTSSLGKALKLFGYRVSGYDSFRHHQDDQDVTMDKLWDTALEVTKDHDAFQDTPWPVFYERLDVAFPGSRFIHVTRNENDWIRSVRKDFGKHHNEMHRLIYGSGNPLGFEQDWLARYRRHNSEAAEYFSGRPETYLHMHMGNPSYGWDALCAFLDLPKPAVPWPHANPRGLKARKAFIARNLHRLQRLVRRPNQA